jgi:hypothetical protein
VSYDGNNENHVWQLALLRLHSLELLILFSRVFKQHITILVSFLIREIRIRCYLPLRPDKVIRDLHCPCETEFHEISWLHGMIFARVMRVAET